MKNCRSIHVRFNLDRELHRRALNALQNLDRHRYPSWNQAIIQAIAAQLGDGEHAEDAAAMDACAARLAHAVEDILEKTLPMFIAGYLRGASVPVHEEPAPPDAGVPKAESVSMQDIDWEFLGE